MSIEITQLDLNDNPTAVKNWLDANKDGFFDTVTLDGSNITCNVTGGGTLFLIPGTREGHYFQSNNGTRANLDLYNGSFKFSTAVKTSKGLVLITELTANEGKCAIFIAKTNNDTICAAWYTSKSGALGNVSELPGIRTMDFHESNVVFNTGGQTTLLTNITSIASLPIGDTWNVSDGLYMMASGYNWFNGPVELNGKNYFEYQTLFLEE